MDRNPNVIFCHVLRTPDVGQETPWFRSAAAGRQQHTAGSRRADAFIGARGGRDVRSLRTEELCAA